MLSIKSIILVSVTLAVYYATAVNYLTALLVA